MCGILGVRDRRGGGGRRGSFDLIWLLHVYAGFWFDLHSVRWRIGVGTGLHSVVFVGGMSIYID